MTSRVVAFGGGHGLSATLRALAGLADGGTDLDITAVVTVGDDGGSSGRIRAERGTLPPGDLRQALAALAGPSERATAVATLFQHRFAASTDGGVAAGDVTAAGGAGGDAVDPADVERVDSLDAAATRSDPLAGHTVGNLVLCGLLETYPDPVVALDHAAAMVDARGRVLPMSPVQIGIEADVRERGSAGRAEFSTVVGQHAVAVTDGHVEAVRLIPIDPPACEEAIRAVLRADWLIFGPGSWYTSVIPHLLVPDLAKAILSSPAKRLVILNLAVEKETMGLSLSDHLDALTRYLPGLRVDVVLADGKAVGDPVPVQRAAQSLGARLVLARVAVDGAIPRHDPLALASALAPMLPAAQ